MAAKQIFYDTDARERMLNGIRKLTKAVSGTLGPSGHTVILQKRYGSPVISNDGVTIANEIELPDAFENIGVELLKEVASRTAKEAGDGTTTAMIYAAAIFREGLKNVTAGAQPLQITRGIDRAVRLVIDELRAMSKPIASSTEIRQVATCAANHDVEIGRIIAEAMERVGKDGVVTIEEGTGLDTTVDIVQGMQFDKGYVSPHFVTDVASMKCDLEDCYILVHEKKLTSAKDLLPLLGNIAKAGKALLVIAEEIEDEALATLVVNKLRGALKVAAVKAPGFGDRRIAMLEDIAVMTGATPIMEALGTQLEDVDLSSLGRAKKVTLDKDTTLIIEGAGKRTDIEARVMQIRTHIESSEVDYDREILKERLARLAGGIAQINVGAATETAMKERAARVDDAVQACRAAVEEGILPGGGVAMLRARRILAPLMSDDAGDESVGVAIVYRALAFPLRQIAINCGLEGSIVVAKVEEAKDANVGFNALSHTYEDLIDAGVIVPTKVERVALENAASVAGLLLTTDCAIAEIKEKKRSASPSGTSDMGDFNY
jgi:chaperonin GroEL